MRKLSVVIVNYNVKYFLEQALLSVRRAAAGLDVEVWVVDNNSVDDSVSLVREKFPEVRLIANRDNPGFAVANNQAIRQCTGEYVLLLNPDTVVEEDTFARCVAFMDAHPEAGGLGVRMIDGAGKFLPESKRGFPSPWVAFAKAFGLSWLFPRSPLFNHYHLGYLDEHETHEVEVLAGAFMWLRRRVLDEVGLLDEAFFMYGEDIDLSYRIVQAGHKNYYYPHTTIIHYKGESTKRGSLNYVRTFYQAMIIFARKHFAGRQARLFVWMLHTAVYVRAGMTVAGNLVRRLAAPALDAALLYAGLVALRDFWAGYHFGDPHYYDGAPLLHVNFPLYVLMWLAGIYFSGGYDAPQRSPYRLVRGLLAGTLVLAAVYGFLDLAYRPSRALIVLGAGWAVLATVGWRLLAHAVRHRNLNAWRQVPRNLVIVGGEAESQRVRGLLQAVQVQKNFIGTVAPHDDPDTRQYLGGLAQLEEVVQIYRVQDVIFCSRDISAQHIMQWMCRLGPELDYKIVPEDSLSIIGSSSRNSAGELYTIDVRFLIATPLARRHKRVFDVTLAIALLLAFPLLWVAFRHPAATARRAVAVLLGRRSWVGYADAPGGDVLPRIRPGVLTPLHALPVPPPNDDTVRRLNLLYAKDYHVSRDAEVVWRGWRGM